MVFAHSRHQPRFGHVLQVRELLARLRCQMLERELRRRHEEVERVEHDAWRVDQLQRLNRNLHAISAVKQLE